MIRIGVVLSAALALSLAACNKDKSSAKPNEPAAETTDKPAEPSVPAKPDKPATEATPTEAAGMGKLADAALVASDGSASTVLAALGEGAGLLVYYRGHW